MFSTVPRHATELEAPRAAAVAVAVAAQPQLLPQPAAGHGKVQRSVGVHGELQGPRLFGNGRRQKNNVLLVKIEGQVNAIPSIIILLL